MLNGFGARRRALLMAAKRLPISLSKAGDTRV
jgi:hypothetical protein